MLQLTNEYPQNAASPTNQPGCFICGASKRIAGPESHRDGGEYLIDLGVSTDEIQELDGTTHSSKKAIVCEACVRQLATMIDCLTPEATRQLRGERDIALAELEILRSQASEYATLKQQLAKARI